MRPLELTGQKFGKLTAIRWTGHSNSQGLRLWLCKCECGNYREVPSQKLSTGQISACVVCAKKAKFGNIIIGRQISVKKAREKRRCKIHNIWTAMKQRCYNPNNKSYPYYGGRGITVCEEWNNSYKAFKDWALNNGYNDNLTIDRIDNNGNYEPNNCRWVSQRKQCWNKRETVYISYGNKKIPLAQLVYDLGLDYDTIHYYITTYKGIK